MGRSSQWIRILAFGAASLVVAACSSSSGKSNGSGDTNGNRGGTGNGSSGGGTGTSNGGNGQGNDGGSDNGGTDADAGGGGGSDTDAGGGGTNASCGDATSANACVQCCDQQTPGGLDVFDQALEQCGCASTGCKSVCGSNFCGGNDASDACNTCLQDNCLNQAAEACGNDSKCAQAVQCVQDSGCDGKP